MTLYAQIHLASIVFMVLVVWSQWFQVRGPVAYLNWKRIMFSMTFAPAFALGVLIRAITVHYNRLLDAIISLIPEG
jgi:hypothetical protein